MIENFGQLGWTYLIYGLGFAVLSLLYALLFRHARDSLADEQARHAAHEWARTWALAAVVGVLSGLVAMTPLVSRTPWLPGMIYWLIPLGIWMFAVADRRRTKASKAEG